MSPSTKGAGDFRIDAPLLRLERVRAFVGIETVGVLQFDHAYFADVAVRDHGPHLHQQRMAGEAVGYADDQAFSAASALISLASAVVKNSGFSQMTCRPAFSAARVIS